MKIERSTMPIEPENIGVLSPQPAKKHLSWVNIVVLTTLGLLVGFVAACANPDETSLGKIAVVATTNLVGDVVSQVGGEFVAVKSLMGPGVDPHLYKASEGDVSRMSKADAIFYSGLHLEGKMVELFERIRERGKTTIAITDGIDKSRLIESLNFGGNYDPHVWFDVSMWSAVATYTGESLARIDSANAGHYRQRASEYVEELVSLEAYVREKVATLPEDERVLITSHDAFGYMGRAYDFDVHGLQGLSTALEAGTADVKALAELVSDRKIPAIFLESSVSPKGIEAVREAVRARGFNVAIGGNLFSDALGNADTPEGTFVGMVRHNIDTIVDALSRTETAESE